MGIRLPTINGKFADRRGDSAVEILISSLWVSYLMGRLLERGTVPQFSEIPGGSLVKKDIHEY